jgi:hypothetical protein
MITDRRGISLYFIDTPNEKVEYGGCGAKEPDRDKKNDQVLPLRHCIFIESYPTGWARRIFVVRNIAFWKKP